MPETNIMTDEAVFARACGGDELAFTTLYERWHRPIYRFALQMSGYPTVAEETVQEVFLALIRTPHLFDSAKGSLASYMFGVARHVVWRVLKKERIFVPLDDDHQDWQSDQGSYLSRIDEGHQIEELRKAILGLSKDAREVVVLCDLEEFSYEQAAQVLKCPIGTVRSRLHRARRQLIRRLKSTDAIETGKASDMVGRISYDLS
jgi:RNA polymerase sigma-70 factor, ECF subfamily